MKTLILLLTIANQKGGVGKTTTTVNLAAALASIDKKVLILDVDPQYNSSLSFNRYNHELSIYKALSGEKKLKDLIQETQIPNLKIISACEDLAAAEYELASDENRNFIIKEQLDQIKEEYDYIFIDCAPSLGLITLNALSAAMRFLSQCNVNFLP